MSRKSKQLELKNRRKARIWKLVDDISGFTIYSDDVIIDHKGRIVSRDTYDPINLNELPYPYKARPEVLPFTRLPSSLTPRTDFDVEGDG